MNTQLTPQEQKAAALLILLGALFCTYRSLELAQPLSPPKTRPLRLDPNLASRRTLTVLPGIGFKRANQIVLGRPYGRLEELRPLLGARLLARVRPHLEIKPRAKNHGGKSSGSPQVPIR